MEYHIAWTNNENITSSSHAIMMTDRRGYGCGGLFFQNEVNIPPPYIKRLPTLKEKDL